uniref:Neurobeachin-like protein 2 n=1 Tax=Monodelphis domestica TaxID=13616 RepID=A0A5F8HED5_MONDO
LPPILQLRFIHLFGAIITGGKNALAAVTPSSVEGLLGVLRSWGGPSQDPQLLQLALQGLVGAVHLLHASGAPRRGPELRALLEGYFRVLNTDRPPATTQENSPTPSPTGGEEGLIMLRVSMLDAIPKMLDCADRPVLQAVFLSNNCFEHITRLIQNSKLYLRARSPVASEGGNDLTTQLLTELDIQKFSALSKLFFFIMLLYKLFLQEVFKERIGYSHLFEVLKSQGPPTKRLLQELLNMAVEGDHNACPPPPIRNEQPLLILAQWLPVLPSSDLQVYLAERLRLLCDGGPLSQTTCVKAGLVNYLLEALGTEPALKRQAAEQLLELLQALGGVSLRPEELRCLFRLLWTESGKGAHPYTASVIRALSGMARQKGPERALRYFDLTPSMAGIMVPSIQRWPGAAFSFHAWLCLHQEKQLYSFFTPSGTGFEAFFTSAGMLVVAVCTRKEYMTVSLPEFPFNDSAWHSVAIIHVPGRRPFSQNLLYVYADGQLLKTAPLRCPSLNESFSSCCIGLAGNRTTTTTTGPPIFPGPAYPQQLPFSAHPSLSRSQSFPASMSGSSWGPSANVAGSSREGGVSTTLAGSQDTEWGSPTSLEGQLGSVVIFHEVLQPAHIRTLFTLGPNETSPFKPEGELQELSNKMLLHYTPQACKNKICLDLSPSHGLDGRLTGHKVVNWDVKDVVNCVGGMGVLLPLLEQVGSQPQEAEGQAETHDLVGPELTSSHNGRVERNGVAAFLLMMKNFLRGHLVNQESLMQCHGPAIIGALLQKVPSHCMDMNVLMAAQMLMEQVASEGNGPLLHLLYQHLLFNFNLWSHSDFAVRLGHIQYLSSIIKEHRQKVRKKYGVQYILDSVRAHYRERPLAEDDLRTVQTSLFSLVKEFLARSFSPEEMQAVLNYLAGSSDEGQICGVLDMLLNLLRSSPVQEPLCTFLLEPNNVEVLFALLVHRSFSDQLRDKVFKILNKLLKSDRVPERSKHRLKLKDCGLQGLIACLPDGPVSSHLCRGLSEQVLGTGMAPEEELCNLLTNILFSVTWRGVEGDDEAAWRERGQVFSVLTKLGAAGELVRPPDEIKRSLLEMMLESALTDLQEALPVALPSLTQHVLKLLRLLQDFLHSEGHGNQALWSEKVCESPQGSFSCVPALPVPSLLCGLMHLSLTCTLPQLHALAYVKLHGLLQTAVPPRREEACYLLAKLEAPLARALEAESERCSWLVPLVRTLLDRAYTALGLQWGLPSLPPTNGSPTFYEDFQAFCTSPEWRLFIDKQVPPAMSQFEMDTYARSHDHMSSFWNSCYDALMSSSLRRDRERTESRHLFQELVLEPVMKRGRSEGKRYSSVQKQLSSQHAIALLHWKALGRLLTAPRSAWAQRNPPPPRWKLSSAETYSRMRLKLVPNYHFDQHSEASALRDNLGATDHLIPSTEDSLPLTVAKEAKVSTLQEDQLGEEELTVLDTKENQDSQREKLVLWEDCQLITIVAVIPGRLEVTTQHLYFYDCSVEKEETEEGIGYDFRRPLSQLREVHLRRYNLRRSALELFFTDQANYFLNFPRKVRNKVYSCILGLRPPSQGYYGSHSPQEMLRASGLTQKWVHREISNFEYLMQLNTIAGRTYNDLSQYPVFPWILQDYTSETLDLNDPSVFRDLSKPIGVVNSKHAQLVREKYESFEDPTGTTDKFHYGTHYSNAAGVMHYLIRMEPFTSLHIQLQSGRFDCSDRQFHSVAAAWQARLESPADVKELIPEFFYFPDFLENQNGFDLGSLQLTNERVGDVVLPRWARSREDFIHQHRKALESEHVSAHLHEWIDLIFGCKQRGPAAVEALNVFYYCTYEGAVDLDAVADETERKALEGIISNFGQTPCQLLKEPHPPRLSAEDAARRLARLDTYSPNLFQNLDQLKAFFVEGISDGVPLVLAVVPHRQAHSFMTQGSPDLLVTVSANGLLGTHNWLPYDRNINNYFTFSKDPTVSNAKTQRLLSGPWPPGRGVSGRALAVAPDGKLLFSGGHWDGSLRVTSLPRGKLLSQLSHHIDIVTCLALDLCGLYLISGSRDTTCMVWQVLQQGGLSAGLAPKPVQVLYGHEAEVTCVAISTELDMAVSGSKDGTVIIHTIRRGQFVASLQPLGGAVPGPVAHLALGPEGQIVVQSLAQERPGTSYFLHLYSVNGRLLASQKLEEQSTALALTDAFVLLGTAQCNLHILHLHSLLPAVPSMSMKVPIHSVAVTKERSHILVGLEDGKLIVVGAGQPSEVRSGQFARRLWRSTRRISQVSSGETEYNPPEAK